MRFVIGAIVGLTMAWIVYSRANTEHGHTFDERGPKYQPYVAGYVLPYFLALLYPVGMIFVGQDFTNHLFLSICFSVFLHISVYYAILLPLLPFLRRHISARACAMLWIIPNYLYLLHQTSLELPLPGLVITVPGKLVWALIGIWLAGFLGVLVWKTAGHLHFRRQLLKNAEICADLQTRQQWKLALAQAQCKDIDIPLTVSPHITTPVTVGLFRRTTVVVLPQKQYSREELELIFHHEIVHIGRMDAWNKFFFVFCTAMCWFNPLMWAATARGSEDLELSCDETVLLNADEDTRKQYAGLLLNTAGDGRGFTTCLSNSAKALRYRLKSIVSPRERSTGATAVGIAFCLLAVTNGFVAMAYDETPISEVLFQSGDLSSYVLTVLDSDRISSEDDLDLADTEGITEYLSGLTLYRLTGQYTFSASSRSALFKLHLPGVKTYQIYVYDNAIEVYPLGQDPLRPILYYIPEGIDWDHLDTLIPAA